MAKSFRQVAEGASRNKTQKSRKSFRELAESNEDVYRKAGFTDTYHQQYLRQQEEQRKREAEQAERQRQQEAMRERSEKLNGASARENYARRETSLASESAKSGYAADKIDYHDAASNRMRDVNPNAYNSDPMREFRKEYKNPIETQRAELAPTSNSAGARTAETLIRQGARAKALDNARRTPADMMVEETTGTSKWNQLDDNERARYGSKEIYDDRVKTYALDVYKNNRLGTKKNANRMSYAEEYAWLKSQGYSNEHIKALGEKEYTEYLRNKPLKYQNASASEKEALFRIGMSDDKEAKERLKNYKWTDHEIDVYSRQALKDYYSNLVNNEDFEDKSYKPQYYDAVTIANGKAKETKAFHKTYDDMNIEERRIYNYLFNTEGKESADKYAELITADINERDYKQYIEDPMREWYNSLPGGARAAVGTVGTIAAFAKPVAELPATFDTAYRLAKGEPTDSYDTLNMGGNVLQSIRDIVGEDIRESATQGVTNLTGNERVGNAIGSAAGGLYNAVNAGVESTAGALVYGQPYIVMMGLNAAASTIREREREGYSRKDAVTDGTIDGLAEVISEELSLGAFMEADFVGKTGMALVKELAINTGIPEGTEELTSKLITFSANNLRYGEDSEFTQKVIERLNQNPKMTLKQAKKSAAKDELKKTAIEFVQGYIAGIIGGGAAVAANVHNERGTGKKIKANSEVTQADIQRQLQNEGMKLQEASETAKAVYNDIKGVATQEDIELIEKSPKAQEIRDANKDYRANTGINSLIEQGSNSKNKAVNKVAQEVQNKIETDDKLTNRDVGRLYALVQQDNIKEAQSGNKAGYDNFIRNREMTYEKSQAKKRTMNADAEFEFRNPAINSNGKELHIDGISFSENNGKLTVKTADGEMDAREAADKIINPDVKPLWQAAAEMPNAEAANAFLESYDGEEDIDDYIATAEQLIGIGKTGGNPDKFRVFNQNRENYFDLETRNKLMVAGLESREFKAGATVLGTDRQLINKHSVAIKIIDAVSKRMGFEVLLFDSIEDGVGKYSYNGAQFAGTNRIALSLNAQGNLLLRTYAHEQTHFIHDNNKDGYKLLADETLKALGAMDDDGNINDNVLAKLVRKYAKQEYTGSENLYQNKQIEELIADSMFDVYDKKFVDNLVKSDVSLAEQIKNRLDEFIKGVNAAVQRLAGNGNHQEIELLLKNSEKMEGIRNLFFDALQGATQNYNEGITEIPFDDSILDFSTQDIDELQNEYSEITEKNRKLSERYTNLQAQSDKIKNDERYEQYIQKITDAVNDEELDRLTSEYKDFIKETGLGDIDKELESIRNEQSKMSKRKTELYTIIGEAKEAAAIAKSGKSREDYFRKKALKEFGQTGTWSRTGYLLPNGAQLDFGNPNNWRDGTRVEDHRSIGTIYDSLSDTAAMNDFIASGNIRIMAESPGIDISADVAPTKNQYTMLKRFINEYSGEGWFAVDFSNKDGSSAHKLTYENNINPDRIINDIKNYYVNGATEQSRLSDYYSTQDTDENGFTQEDKIESSDIETNYSVRDEDPPEKTLIAYKAFVVKKGKLYPPMVKNPEGAATPVGVWLNADTGELARDKEGNIITTTSTGRLRVKGKSGTLAWRPGWHLGEYPDAKQFAVKNPETGKLDVMPENIVFAECEIAADNDYQLEAFSYGVNKGGAFNRTQAGLPYIPRDGYYKYRTNPNPDTAPWYITGAMKVTRILTDEECREICAKYNVTSMPRRGGDIDLEAYGLKAGEVMPTADLSNVPKGVDISDEIRNLPGYVRRELNFNSKALIKEFDIDGLDIDYYRKLYNDSNADNIKYSTQEEATKEVFGNQANEEDNATYAKDVNDAGYVADIAYSLQDAEKIGEASENYNKTHGEVSEEVFSEGNKIMVAMANYMRKHIGNYVDVMTKYVTRLANGENADDLYNEYCEERNLTDKQRNSNFHKKRWNLWKAAAKSGDYITAKDVATQDDRDRIINKNGKLAAMVKDAQRYAQSASWAKKKMSYRAYKGDILRLSKNWVETLNSEYGIRMYSFSDFTPAFIVENMQQIMDIAARGLKSLAYTKDTDYAKIFAETGQAINISCFARYDKASGKYVADERQGANWKEAQELRNKHNNVGVVMVAMNDDMIEWALNQDWVDVVIPYHIVKTGTKIANEYDWNNFTADSSDRANGANKTIYPTEHNNDFDTFRNLIEERGLKPRFEKWYNRAINGEISGDTYMKLVNEVRLPASELSAVKPIFDLKAAENSFDKFVKKGGYESGWYLPGTDVEQEVNIVANDIKAGKTSQDVDYGRKGADIINKAANMSTQDELSDIDRYYAETIAENRAFQMIFSNLENAISSQRTSYSLSQKEVDKVVDRILKKWNASTTRDQVKPISREKFNEQKGEWVYGTKYTDYLEYQKAVIDENERLKREYSKKFGNFRNNVTGIFDYMLQVEKNGGDVTSDEIRKYLIQASKDMLLTSEQLDDKEYKRTLDLRKKLREDGIYVSEEKLKALAAEFGYKNTAQLRRHFMGRILLTTDPNRRSKPRLLHLLSESEFAEKGKATVAGQKYTDYEEYIKALTAENNRRAEGVGAPIPLDTLWTNLSAEFPEYFDSENYNEYDQFHAVDAFLDITRPRVYQPFGKALNSMETMQPAKYREKSLKQGEDAGYIEDAALEVATELIAEYGNITRTYTDKQKMLNYVYDVHNANVEYRKKLRAETSAQRKKMTAELIAYEQKKINEYRNARETTERRRIEQNNIDRNWNYVNSRIEQKSKTKHIPHDYEGLAEAFVKAIPGGDNFKAKFNRQDLNNLLVEYKAKVEEVYAGSAAQDEVNELVSKFEDFVNSIPKDNIKGRRAITPEELDVINQVSGNIRYLIDEANKVFVDGKKYDAQQISSKIAAEYNGQKESIFQEDTQNKKAKSLSNLDRFMLGITKPEYLFKNSGSETIYKIYQDIRKGENIEGEILNKSKQAIIQAKKNNHYDPVWSQKTITYKSLTGVKMNMTVPQAMYLYALSRRDQGVQHIIGDEVKNIIGEGIALVDAKTGRKVKSAMTRIDVNNIIAKLSSDQIAYVNEITQFLSNELSKDRNKVSMDIMGFEKYTEKDTYIPIIVDKSQIKQNANVNKGEPSVANQGASKTLVKGAKNAVKLIDFDEVVNNHIHDTAMYCAYASPTENFNRVWNADIGDTSEKIHGLVSKHKGINYEAELHNMIVAVNGGTDHVRDIPQLKGMMIRAKKAATMGNISVMVQQPTSVFRAMRFINPKYFATVASKADIDEMCEWNGCALKKSIGYFDVNVGKTVGDWLSEYDPEKSVKENWSLSERWKNFKKMDTIDELASYGAEKADEITWGAMWLAAKKQIAAEQKLTGDELNKAAAELFQQTIVESQVYDSVFSKPAYMRSKGGMAQLVTAFMSEPLTSFNMMVDGVRNRKITGTKQMLITFADVGLSIAAANACKTLVQMLRRPKDEDEEKDWLVQYLSKLSGNVVSDIFGMVPLIGNVISSLEGYSNDVLALSSIDSIVKTFNSISKVFQKEDATWEDWRKALYNGLNAISQATGVPVYNVTRDIMSIIDKAYNTITKEEPNIPFEFNDLKWSIAEELEWVPGITAKIDYADYVEDYLEGKDTEETQERIGDKVTSVTKAIGEKYRSGKITRAEAKRALMALADKDEKKAETYLKSQDTRMKKEAE